MPEPEEQATVVDFLIKLRATVQQIMINLQRYRLDRKNIRRLLDEYSSRAESDGRLMNAARQEPHCANRGLFLAYTHMELLSWLAKNNYTLLSTSIRWYSWQQFYPKYRIPPIWSSAKAGDLERLLNHIKKTAALVCADLQVYNISIPATAIEYPKVPVEEPAAPPAESYDALRRRGALTQRILEGSRVT